MKKKRNKQIMYVEDDSDTLNAVQIILERQGFSVIGASNGEQAIHTLKQYKLDLILLDIMLPDMSGWEVLRKIRENDNKTKIVILSGIPFPAEKIGNLKEMGVVDYISKPFDNSDLISRVKKAI